MDELTGILQPHLGGSQPSGERAPVRSGDNTFEQLLQEAALNPASPPKEPLPPEIQNFNSVNLLNGQFPPPDSGAGYLFTSVSLINEYQQP